MYLLLSRIFQLRVTESISKSEVAITPAAVSIKLIYPAANPSLL